MLSLIFTKIILLLFYLFYFFMKIIFIFSCSGMFRYVPGCSVMFRVPGFIEAHHSFAYFKMEERRGRRGFRFTEAQQYASRNFRKAFYAIRTDEEGHTGMACAVETEDENNDRIRLVTCSDTWNSVSNSVQMVPGKKIKNPLMLFTKNHSVNYLIYIFTDFPLMRFS